MKTKVLILDAHVRKAIPIVQGIGMADRNSKYEIIVASHKRFIPIRYSKYVRKYINLPHPYGEEYINSLTKVIKSMEIDIILPLEDESVEQIAIHKNELQKYAKFLAPDLDKFETFRDKWKTYKFLRSLGIETPKTVLLSDFLQGKTLNFPVIIKPRKGRGSLGIKRIYSQKELEKNIEKISKEKIEKYIVQEMLPKHYRGYGASFLYNENGEALLGFVHKRLREYPPEGGPSTYCVSVKNPFLLSTGKKILDNIGWTGFAMVEFRGDETENKFYVLEINPRTWGSITLPIFAGVNFPFIYCEYLKGNMDIEKNFFDYSEELYMKWLLGDILYFFRICDISSLFKSLIKERGDITYYVLDTNDIGVITSTIFITLCNLLNFSILRKILR